VNYDFSIRPNRTGKTAASRGSVEFVVARFSQFRRTGPGLFVHADDTGRQLMVVQLGEGDPVPAIRVSIPMKNLKTDGVPILNLCFRFADQLGWGILDEQMGSYLERDAIPNVLNYCAALDESVTQFLNRRPPGRARFSDMFLFYARTHTRMGLVSLIGCSALIAGFAVIYFDMRLIHFASMSVAMFAAMVSIKALIQCLRRVRRYRIANIVTRPDTNREPP